MKQGEEIIFLKWNGESINGSTISRDVKRVIRVLAEQYRGIKKIEEVMTPKVSNLMKMINPQAQAYTHTHKHTQIHKENFTMEYYQQIAQNQ